MVELGDPGPGKPRVERPRRKRRAARRALQWLLTGLVAIAALAVIAFFFLTRTDPGARLTIEQVLKRLPIQGEITVEGARSDRLLEGVRLYGIRITGPEGRVFLVADSAHLRYGWRTLVSGDVVFDRLHVFQPDVVLSRYPDEEEFNVQRLFISEEEARDDTVPPQPTRVIFEDVRIVGGDVRVFYPQEGDPPDRVVTVAVPPGQGEGLLRRLVFREVEASLPRVVLSSPGVQGQRVEVESLSTMAQVYRDPFRLRGFAGTVAYDEGRVDIEADRLALDGSEASGDIYVRLPDDEDEPLRWGFNLRSGGVDLADLQWIDPRIPVGTARGGFALVAEGERLVWTFADARVRSGADALDLDGTLVMGEGERVAFQGLEVTASPVDLGRLDAWLEEPLPFEGSVTGNATLDGTLARLRADGRVTLRRRGAGATPITARFGGVLHLEDGLGFTGLRATLDPFDFGILPELTPLELGGTGRVTFEATGTLNDAIRFTAEIDHRVSGAPNSHVRASGSVRQARGTYVLDVQGDVSPLSLTALRRWYPDLPLTGEVSGSIRARGPLTDLALRTDLDTEAGRLALDVRLDATDPGAFYSAEGEVTDFQLSRLVPALPRPTVITGRVDIEGRGLDPATAAVDARLDLESGSRVGGLMVSSAAVALRVAGGVLHVDTLDAVAGGVRVQGVGTLAMEEGGPQGTVTLAFQADSLAGLRPLLFGDSVIVIDELSSMEREVLAAEGVDLDTLPTSGQVRVGGAASGQVTLTGSVQRFSAEGEASFERLEYGRHVVQEATVTFSGTDLPGLEGDLHATLQADSLQLFGRAFAGADIQVDYTHPEGRVTIQLDRHEDEDYRARAAFQVDTLGGTLQIEELALRFDTLVWQLERPTTVAWTGEGLRVDDLVLVRPGEDPLRIEARGVLPTEGEADFSLTVDNLHLQRLATLMQREELGISGHVDLDLRIRGTAAAPLITGLVEADSLAYRDFELTRVVADVDYAGQSLQVDLAAWSDSLQVLTAVGSVPVDLALQGVEDRFPDRPMDVAVTADSLPAAFVLATLQNVTDVDGTVSGRFTIRGTVSDPEPEGTLALNGAAFYLEDLGVRYEDVGGTLTLQGDGRLAVDAVARAGGTARVTGTIALDPLSDPTFDLEIVLREFEAVDREDVEGVVSGSLQLTRSYRSPLVTGNLAVNRGVLYLEEFIRASTVVDLSDPRYFEVVDTALFSARPILEASQNPFMQNLRVSIDMEVRQDTWLRSEELNVEIAGQLIVTYDRSRRDIVLVGDLRAVRGSYAVLGRNFDVQEGTVEFVGTPGINPNLAITAATQVRQPDRPPIRIVATVTGTLEDPHVALGSEEAALSQSDLVSYLIFGQPSYALASAEQQRLVAGAAGSLVAGATASVLSGTVANRLSALLAQQWGFLDYFAISQVGDLGVGGGGGGGRDVFAGTVVELGSYLGDEFFFSLLLQPFSRSGDQFAGARLEWQIDNYWTLEAFVEERFLRGQVLGFQDNLGYESRKIFGLFVFWERGY